MDTENNETNRQSVKLDPLESKTQHVEKSSINVSASDRLSNAVDKSNDEKNEVQENKTLASQEKEMSSMDDGQSNFNQYQSDLVSAISEDVEEDDRDVVYINTGEKIINIKIRNKVAYRCENVKRNAMGRKEDEDKMPLTNMAMPYPGPAQYDINYKSLEPEPYSAIMVEPASPREGWKPNVSAADYDVSKDLKWKCKKITIKPRCFPLIKPGYRAGPGDRNLRKCKAIYKHTPEASIIGRQNPKVKVGLINKYLITPENVGPGPKYDGEKIKNNAPSACIVGKKITKMNRPIPAPNEYNIGDHHHDKNIPGGNFGIKTTVKQETDSPGPIYYPKVRKSGKKVLFKGRLKDFTAEDRPSPQTYFVRYGNEIKHPGFTMVHKPFESEHSKTAPGPGSYGYAEYRQKNRVPTIKGRLPDKKIETIPGPGDYNIVSKDSKLKPTIKGKTCRKEHINANPAPWDYDLDSTIGQAPAYSLGQRPKEVKIDTIPSPNKYSVGNPLNKRLPTTLKSRFKEKVGEEGPGPKYLPSENSCVSVQCKGASLSSRHSPWVYSQLKRFS